MNRFYRTRIRYRAVGVEAPPPPPPFPHFLGENWRQKETYTLPSEILSS